MERNTEATVVDVPSVEFEERDVIADDLIDIEALEAIYADEESASEALDDAFILELIDLIADDDGIIQISDSGFPITLMSDVSVVEHTIEGENNHLVHHYHFENDLVVLSEAEINIVISTA